MAALKSYSTSNMPPKQALAYWNDWVSEAFTQLQVSPLDSTDFSANLEFIELAYLRLANPVSSPATVSHSVAQGVRASDDVFLLHLQITGNSNHQQCGHEAILNVGDYTLCDSTRPYKLTFKSRNDMLVVVIPKAELSKRLAHPESYTCLQIPSDHGIGNIFSQYIQSVWTQCRNERHAGVENRLADNILDLLSTSYAAVHSSMVEETSVITSHRLMLRAFIEQNLAVPELSLVLIAAAMGYSTGYLHQLFKGEGESIGRYIIRRRLEESARSLRDGQQHGRMISTIAYQWGFKSTAHFTRAFKEHYAVTPREYRALNTNFHCA